MDRDDKLADLLVAWESATAQGQTLTPEDVCRDCPELLTDFRKLLQKLGRVHAALGAEVATDPADQLPRVDAGRYKPVSFHAAGGLGVVFTAEDAEVGRVVALKCMQNWTTGDPSARRRFLLEAEVTGKLEHPGIVPVYGMGQDGRGRPFYAMRFVRGNTLRDQVEWFHAAGRPPGRSVEFVRLLRSFVAVCEAVAYAHSRGVIHRDIKPANVLIGEFGETLLVDWGLAQRVGVPDVDDLPGSAPLPPVALRAAVGVSRSASGGVKGTPAYMSPEQALNEVGRVGPASDVFALGATLYAVLTGRPPYQGPAALEDAKLGRFDPPRRVKPSVPRALEAVCLRAMAARPEDRYPGAKPLARDVERWLADEPVSAWREPLGVRARRWVKRHRTLVTAAALAVLAAAVVATAAAVQIGDKNRQLAEEVHNKDVLNAQLREEKDRSEANYRDARRALRGMLQRLRDPRYAGVPRVLELHRAQAEDALAFFRSVSGRRDDPSPEVRYDAALADGEAAELAGALGRSDALDYARRSADALARLAAEFPDDRRYRYDAAFAATRLGSYLPADPAHEAEKVRLLAEAIAAFRRLAADPAAVPNDRVGLANALNALASFYWGRSRHAEADPLYREAYDIRVKVAAEVPGDREASHLLAGSAQNLGLLYQNTGRWKDAAPLMERADATLTRLVEADPDDRSAAVALAVVRVNRGYALTAEGRRPEAIDGLTRIAGPLERLYRLEPEDAGVRDKLYRVYALRADLYEQQHRPADAARDYEQALPLAAPDGRPFLRLRMAAARCNAGDLAGCLRDLETQLQQLGPDGPARLASAAAAGAAGDEAYRPAGRIPEQYVSFAATVSGLTAARLRAVGALAGAPAAADLEAAERLAVRWFARLKAVLPALRWVGVVIEVRTTPHLAPLARRADFQALLAEK